MAHFAQIVDKENFVVQVIVVGNNDLLDENNVEQEQKGIDFCVNLFGGTWVQTSYNATFRKNFASIGYSYDTVRDAFIPPKVNCHTEEALDEETCRWTCSNPEHNEVNK